MDRLYIFGNSHVWCILGSEGASDTRLESRDGDLELVGWKLGGSGATAYGLVKRNSTTRAGESIVRLLDAEPGQKTVLMVFGEVDVSEHIGRRGVPEDESIRDTVAQYIRYLRDLVARPDVDSVLVASVVPHKSGYHADDGPRIRRICEGWCREISTALADEPGMTYVDWYSAIPKDSNGDILREFELRPGDMNDCHMATSLRPLLLQKVREALCG